MQISFIPCIVFTQIHLWIGKQEFKIIIKKTLKLIFKHNYYHHFYQADSSKVETANEAISLELH